jgi:hypothetical protein
MSTKKQPDKEAVFDEVWDDARVRSFLDRDTRSVPGHADFHLLLHAYQSMRAADFARFVRFFVEAGHDLDAENERGQTFADYAARHRRAGEFVNIVCSAGARAPVGDASRTPSDPATQADANKP